MDITERTAALTRLLDCSPEAGAALANAMRPRGFRSKDYLSHQGEACDLLWLILEGTVQLQAISAEGQVTILSAFGPGELIGGYGDADETGFDTRALTKTQTLEIDAGQLRTLLAEWPELGVGLSRIYAGQLDTVLDRLAVRVTLSAMGRFYRELLRQAGEADAIAPPPVIAALALSAQTTRETGSRAISTLERRGIIERDNERLTIVSRRMLEEMVI